MKTFKEFLTEDKQLKEYYDVKLVTKYRKGDFGHWWVSEMRRPDIEGEVYEGNLFIVGEKFTSLKGCPKEVRGNFECMQNKLTSLKGCSSIVRGNFDCCFNFITSLKGGPKEVGGNFDCRNNSKLKSLDGIGKVKGKILSDIK